MWLASCRETLNMTTHLLSFYVSLSFACPTHPPPIPSSDLLRQSRVASPHPSTFPTLSLARRLKRHAPDGPASRGSVRARAEYVTFSKQSITMFKTSGTRVERFYSRSVSCFVLALIPLSPLLTLSLSLLPSSIITADELLAPRHRPSAHTRLARSLRLHPFHAARVHVRAPRWLRECYC